MSEEIFNKWGYRFIRNRDKNVRIKNKDKISLYSFIWSKYFSIKIISKKYWVYESKSD